MLPQNNDRNGGIYEQNKTQTPLRSTGAVPAVGLRDGNHGLCRRHGRCSSAVESTWKTASGQIKTVVNNVVFPAIDLILAVFFFAKLGTAYFDFRKSGQFEWTAPAILFACLVFTLTAPLYIWQIIGI